jgi:hypothetical protein
VPNPDCRPIPGRWWGGTVNLAPLAREQAGFRDLRDPAAIRAFLAPPPGARWSDWSHAEGVWRLPVRPGRPTGPLWDDAPADAA